MFKSLLEFCLHFFFGFFFSFFGKGRAKSGDKTDVINNIYEKSKQYDNHHRTTNSGNANVEEKIRKFVRVCFDRACIDIVSSCQGMPDRDRYAEVNLKIMDYYEKSLKNEPGFEEIRQKALDNDIDLDKILEEEFKRVLEIYADPFDYI